jgi:hypothetical protein
MGVLITLFREGWLGGVGWGQTSLGVLAIAGFFTCVAAAIGAVTATAIARPAGPVAAVIMSCLVGLETTALRVTHQLSGPPWWDLPARASPNVPDCRGRARRRVVPALRSVGGPFVRRGLTNNAGPRRDERANARCLVNGTRDARRHAERRGPPGGWGGVLVARHDTRRISRTTSILL